MLRAPKDRFLLWLLAALALHSGILAVLSLTNRVIPQGPSHQLSYRSFAGDSQLHTIDIIHYAPVLDDPERIVPIGTASVTGPRAAHPPAGSSPPGSAANNESTEFSAPVQTILDEAAGAPLEKPDDWSLSPRAHEPRAGVTSVPVDLGIGPKLSFRLAPTYSQGDAPGEQSTLAAAKADSRRVQEAVRELADAHDVTIGVGRGGAAVSAAREAARGDFAPVSGTTLFEVTVDSNGVTWAGVSNAQSDYDGWQKVAVEIASRLRGKALRIPEGSRGLRFQIEVNARVVEVDGSRAPKGTKAEVIVGEKNGLLTRLPGAYSSGGGRICQYQVAIVPIPQMPLSIGGSCGFEKLSTKPMRVVSARLVSESRL